MRGKTKCQLEVCKDKEVIFFLQTEALELKFSDSQSPGGSSYSLSLVRYGGTQVVPVVHGRGGHGCVCTGLVTLWEGRVRMAQGEGTPSQGSGKKWRDKPRCVPNCRREMAHGEDKARGVQQAPHSVPGCWPSLQEGGVGKGF